MSDLDSLLSAAAPARPDWEDVAVPVPGAGPLRLRLRGHRRAPKGQPWVLHFHGGAFVGGSLEAGAAVAGVLQRAGAAVVSLDYPLAPAHPFPAAIDAGGVALAWLAHRLRRRQAPLFVAGEEAGGNLAAAVAMIARDRAVPPLAGAILLSPMLDVCVATASQRDAMNGPVGCPCADGWRAYLAGDGDALHPYAVPARSMRLAGLPPTLLVTAADDPLRDETCAYAQRLRDAGVPVQLHWHDEATQWPVSYQQPGTPAWAAALHDPVQAFLTTSSTARSLP